MPAADAMERPGNAVGYASPPERTKGATDEQEWFGGMARRTEGREGDRLHAERRAQGCSIFVFDALRERHRNESRGADRGRARRLLLDGAVGAARECKPDRE